MLAALHVIALPLQLLARREPRRQDGPSAVVDSERAQALLLSVNSAARAAGLLPGLRLGEAQSIAPTLRAGVVTTPEVATAQTEIIGLLRGFSPRVEQAEDPPGLFWLDAQGLRSLYGNLRHWGELLQRTFARAHYDTTLVIGFARHRLRALALSRTGLLVFSDPERERRLAAEVPLTYVELPSWLRRELGLLGLRTLGDLELLPNSELRLRYGAEVAALHAELSGHHALPLRPQWPVLPHRAALQLEPPEQDRTRLLFAVKRLLHPLLAELAARGESVVALVLLLRREKTTPQEIRLESAAPTRDALRLLELIRLRLERHDLGAAVTELVLTLESLLPRPEQLELLALAHARDLEAGARALARLKAAFGDAAVTRARLRSAHLPEASFAWEETSRLVLPQMPATPTAAPPLVRRLLATPKRLAPPRTHNAIAALIGPERLSGGWWRRLVVRDYYFAETPEGVLLWIYYDHRRRQWMQHGLVE